MVLLPGCSCCDGIKCLNLYENGSMHLPDYIEVDFSTPGVSGTVTENTQQTTLARYADCVQCTTTSLQTTNVQSGESKVEINIPSISGRFRFYPAGATPGYYYAAGLPGLTCVVQFVVDATNIQAAVVFVFNSTAAGTSTRTSSFRSQSWELYYEYGSGELKRVALPPVSTQPVTRNFHHYNVFYTYLCGITDVSTGTERANSYGQSGLSEDVLRALNQANVWRNTTVCNSNTYCKYDGSLDLKLNHALPVTIQGSVVWCGTQPGTDTSNTYGTDPYSWDYGLITRQTVAEKSEELSGIEQFDSCSKDCFRYIGFRHSLTINEIDLFRNNEKKISLSEKPIQPFWGYSTIYGNQFLFVNNDGYYCPDNVTVTE